MLPKEFFSLTTDVLADQARYMKVSGTRQVARRREYGAPATRRELVGISSQDVKLLHFFESKGIDVKLYQSLRNYTDYNVQNMGMQELARQAAQFRALFDNIRLAAVYMMLGTGILYFDSDGNLLPSSSGSAFSFDYGISANHLNQLNTIIGASWATTSTNIVLDVTQIKDQALKDTGYPIEMAFYGQNISTYIANNATAQEFLVRNPQMNQQFLDTGEIPNGFLGLTWVPVHSAFFADNDGTNQTFFGGDTVTFTPRIDRSWYEMVQGSYPVPTTFNPFPTAQAAVGSFDLKYGPFSFAVPQFAPPWCEMYYGDTFLPLLKNPDVIFIADVTP